MIIAEHVKQCKYFFLKTLIAQGNRARDTDFSTVNFYHSIEPAALCNPGFELFKK